MIVRSCHGSIVNGSVYDSRFRFLLGLCRARHARVGCGSEIRTRPKTTGNDERERAGKRPGTEFSLVVLVAVLVVVVVAVPGCGFFAWDPIAAHDRKDRHRRRPTTDDSVG